MPEMLFLRDEERIPQKIRDVIRHEQSFEKFRRERSEIFRAAPFVEIQQKSRRHEEKRHVEDVNKILEAARRIDVPQYDKDYRDTLGEVDPINSFSH